MIRHLDGDPWLQTTRNETSDISGFTMLQSDLPTES